MNPAVVAWPGWWDASDYLPHWRRSWKVDWSVSESWFGRGGYRSKWGE